MLIKYKGQLYKRVDAGEQKIAEVLKRKLQEDFKKAQSIDPDFKSATLDITGSIDETRGGSLEVWLNFKGSVDEARRLVSLMGTAMSTTVKQVDRLPFFAKRYWISASLSSPSGGGSRRKIGYITVKPQQRFLNEKEGVSNAPLLSKIGLSQNEKRGYPRRSEDYKDQDAADAAKYAGDNLELHSDILRYADKIGRLDTSLAREVKAIYAKSHELARKCKELYRKYDRS